MLESGSRRIAYIDGLRAIAVLGVVGYHAAKDIPGVSEFAAPSSPLMLFLRQGCRGVDLFFVLSGFCLAYPTLRALHSRSIAAFDVPAYAARRLARIVPPYYAAIALFALMGIAFVHSGLALPKSMAMPTWIVVLHNALFLDGKEDYLNLSFWTLFVEFRWYFLFPAALWLWIRSPRFFLAGMALVMFTVPTRAASVDLAVLPAFLLGIVTAALHARETKISRLLVPAFVVAVAIGVVSTSQDWHSGLSRAWQLAAFLFIILAGSSPLISRVLSLKALTVIGVASYSIYLVHEPIIDVLVNRGFGALPAAVIAVAFGIAFWAVVERPLVAGALHKRILSELQFLHRWFGFLGMRNPLVFLASVEQNHGAPVEYAAKL